MAIVIFSAASYAVWKSNDVKLTPKISGEPVGEDASAESVPIEVSTTETEELPALDTSDWSTYRNDEYGFEFQYDNSWIVEEIKKPYGRVNVRAISVTKQDYEIYI